MKSKKTIVGISIVCIVIGSICMGLGLVMGGSFRALQVSMGFDRSGFVFREYDDIEFENQTLSDITSLKIDMDMGDVTIIEGNDDDIRISNMVKDQYTLDVNGSKAELKLNTRSGFSIFNFGTDYSQDIVVTIPEGYKFENLEIKNSMGNIDLEDLQVDSMTLVANMGDIDGENLKTNELFVENDMGKIQLEGIFLNETEITNSMGDIDVIVNDDISNYDYEADCSLGTVYINGKKGNSSQSVRSNNKITIKDSMGDISLDFD